MNQFTASIWGDEGFSAILSMKSIPEIISIVARDTSPPLYNITEHLWFQMFGTSEVAIRSLSFLYYSLAIFFVYKIGTFFWDRKTGILVSVLAFFNPFFFIYAFEGRMYSILALGVTASMYFFIRLLFDKKSNNKILIGYVVATLWAMYSHHFAIFALFVQGIWFVFEFVKNRERSFVILKGFIAVGILYAPWIIPLYKQTKMVGGGFWLGQPTITDLRELIYRYLGQGITHQLAQYALWASLAGLVIRAWKKDTKKNLFLLSWFLIPLLVAWSISQVFTPIFFDRYLITTIPAGMLLLGSNRRQLTSNIAIALALGLFLIIDLTYFTHPAKRPFREFAQVIKENMAEGDYLINWSAQSHHLWETKYYGIGGPIYIAGEGELPFFVGTALMEEKDIIRSIPESASRVGAITSGSVDEVYLDGYTKVSFDQVGDLKVIWLTKSY
jgi:hypothetical protein